ncbi:hypothetical protein Poli38472_003934 [Pythium oligandrum]|uniref:C2CD3 N-terminal C2 domain-containing protein n=1 Tax=Pythium oligandrum TaxID=41045 RepID=A0A8K1CN56_PYTOL|nr:hypothetical protein Poli38472_003934 [Pythium oligandrum]|eukprot:TMW66169.1 hypothetical protein Poli38472_003934 [Pythium oligandrum]
MEMAPLRASERLVQELTGCSLPPQVEEEPLGAVLLSVTHILPSTAVGGEEETTSVGIPRVSLVRVRWWGEDKPDTLFRPVRVGHDGNGRVGGGGDEEEKGEDAEEEEEETRSWIRMRYPVCAPAEQLLEYFHDMRELVLDVIDRKTRRRYEKLRYTNELMEIRALEDPDHVVGYLAVNFEVEWHAATAITPSKWVNEPSTPSISVNTAMIDHPAAHAVPFFDPGSARKRLSFSSISSSSTGGDRYDRRYTPFSSSYAQGRDDRGKVVTNTRLEELLAKGRALQQSMSQAAEYENVQVPSDPLALIADNLSPSNPVLAKARMSTMLAPYEAVTEEQDTDWQRVLDESEQIPRRETSTAEVLRELEDVSDFSHLNAFPFGISDQSIICLQGGFLILEVWVEEKTVLPSHPIATFLGVAKIPLRSFQFVFRDGKLHGLCRQISPLVGIDEDIPIANPLTGTTTGSMHVKIALGTAEQLFNLRATIKAVTKFQSIVRGYQVRQALGFPTWHLESSAQSSQLLTPSSDYDDVGSSQAVQHDTSPDVPPRMVERSVRFIQLDIRLELRGPSAQQRGFSTVGCEVHGKLRLGNEALVLGADGGLQFVLWWDANDQRLNSQFVHSFHSHNGSAMEIRLHDVSAMFQIIPQHVSKGISTGEDIGQAALDLSSLWHSSTVQTSTEKEESQTVVRDVDLPITWSPGNRNDIEALPLRVSIKIYQEDSTTDAEPTQQIVTIEDERVVTSTTIATMERLLPASLALCFDFQRLSDLKMLVSEVWKGLSTRTDVDEESRVLVRSILETGHGFLAMEFSICLGNEVHNAEKQSKTVVYDNVSRRWFKQFRLEAIPVDIVDGVQLLPSVACVEALVIVHPELIEKLQESNLDVSLWLRGEEAKTATTLPRIDLGVVSVPLAPILFRPNGVQGSFPVQNSKGFAGRLGVHLFVEHDSNDDGDARENPEESYPQNAMDHLSHPSVSERLQNSLTEAQDDVTPDSSEDNVGPGNVSIDSGDEDTAVKSEDGIIVSTNEDTGDHTSEAIEPSSSQTEEVGTLAQAVASINEATQEINLRLQRLLLSSSALVSEVEESVTSSVGMTEKAEPMPTLVDDHDREDYECKTIAVEYAGTKDDNEDGRVMEIHEIHSASASEGSPLCTMWDDDRVKSGADEDDNDDEYFQPITLASLGISEMEFSPVSVRTSASLYAVPLGVDEVTSQPSSPPIPHLTDDDSFVDQLASLSSEEENANDGGVADELELPSVFADSTENVEEECRQVEHDEVDKPTQLGEVELVENEAIKLSDNQGLCIEMPELQHDADDNALDNWNNPSTCFSEQDDSTAEEDSWDVHRGTTDIQDVEAIPQQHLHEIPAGDTEEVASATVEGYLVEDSSAVGSPINPPHVQERGEDNPLAAFVGFKGFDLSVCSSRLSTATTTEDKSTQVEIGDSVDTFNLLEEKESGETESGRTSHSVEAPSSEAPDDISVHRDHAHERNASNDNCVLEEPVAPSRLQMSRQSSGVDAGCQTEAMAVSSHEMPTANSSEQGIRVESVALPIEKFNLAWQLLSEIRSVYVDGVTPAASPLKTPEYQPFASGRSSFFSSSLVYEEKADLETDSDGHAEEEVSCRHPRQYETETTRTVGQGFDVDAFQDERYGERHEHRMASGEGYDHHNRRVVREMEDRGPSSWQWLNKEELQKEIIVRIKASGADEDDVKWSEVVSSPKSQWRSSGIGHRSSAVRVTSATSVARPTSAKRSLFKDNTETERIARIMQGSIKYWLQDSSEEEFTSDDEDEDTGAGFF